MGIQHFLSSPKQLIFEIALIVVIVCASLIILAIFGLNYHSELVTTPNTSYYFASTVLQVNSTTVSIIGLFAIFWIQNLKNRISDIKKKLEIEFSSNYWENRIYAFEDMNVTEKKYWLDNPTYKLSKLESMIKLEWYNIADIMRHIKMKMTFMVVIFLVISCKDIILLITSELLNSIEGSYPEIIMLASALIQITFMIYIGYFIVLMISKSIK